MFFKYFSVVGQQLNVRIHRYGVSYTNKNLIIYSFRPLKNPILAINLDTHVSRFVARIDLFFWMDGLSMM